MSGKKNMKTYFIIILSFFNNTSLYSELNLYFRLIETPKGNTTDIGLIQILKNGEIAVTQYERDIFYRLYYSPDNGFNWTERDTNAFLTKAAVLIEAYNNDLFTGPMFNILKDGDEWLWYENGLWVSTNYGWSWDWRYHEPFYQNKYFIYHPTVPNEIQISYEDGFIRSRDYGATWRYSPIPVFDWVYFMDKQGSVTIFSDRKIGLTKSNFSGFWEEIWRKSNFPEARFRILRPFNEDFIIGYSNVNTETNGIYLSEDGGYNWTKIKPIGEFSEVLAIETYKDIIVAGDNLGLEISYDAGKTWGKCILPEIETTNKAISKITINQDNGDIYCIYGGSYLIKGNLEGIKDSTLDLPYGYFIYPNPASDKVIINSRGLNLLPYRLSIFNLIGQEIYSKTLDVGRMEVDVSEWATGIYIVRCGEWTGRFLKL